MYRDGAGLKSQMSDDIHVIHRSLECGSVDVMSSVNSEVNDSGDSSLFQFSYQVCFILKKKLTTLNEWVRKGGSRSCCIRFRKQSMLDWSGVGHSEN
jgi:hypothetical protein